jgi:signal transduction histidine kinase
MRQPDRLWIAAAVATPVLTAIAALLVVTSPFDPHPARQLVTGLFIGLSFTGSGLVAWWRRPDNHTGRLLVLVGLTFYLGALTDAGSPTLFTIGLLLGSVPVAALVQLLLAYPSGSLRTATDRRIVQAGYAVVLLGLLAILVVEAEPAKGECPGGCPRNVMLIWDEPTAARVINDVVEAIAVVLLAITLVRLVRRWRAASGAYRRSVRPVLLTGGLTFALFLVQFVAMAISHRVGSAVNLAAQIAFMSVPAAFVYGLARESLAQGGVARLALELPKYGPAGLGDALRDVLHDPTLYIAYRLPDGGYATVDGKRVTLPPPEWPGLTLIEPVAAVVHDPALRGESRLLDAALATARLALENERLQAELAARLEELKAAHARGLDAVIGERRRLERNLHDGAQQRLVALALTLRMAKSRLPDGADAAAELLDGATAELAGALEDLRELARGIHPAVLSERGLGPALESLVTRSRLPVQVARLPEERLPESVEIAAYYVVAEALTNIAKYAAAHEVVVSVDRVNGYARIEIADDGTGGADPGNGTGLRGLADRLALLGGKLEIESPPGCGTRVSAEIPVG